MGQRRSVINTFHRYSGFRIRRKTVTVCVLDADIGEMRYERITDTYRSVAELLTGWRNEDAIRTMFVDVGTQPENRKVYAFTYRKHHGTDEKDETVVFRSDGADGKNVFTGIPCGTAVIYRFHDTDANHQLKPDSLTQNDMRFLDHHIFSADGHVFLMAEANRRYGVRIR